MDSLIVHIILIIFLLCFSALMSCSETAFFSLSRVEIHRIKRALDWPTRRLRALLRHPREILVTILIGNELANISISVVAAALVSQFMDVEWQATIVSIAAVTPLILLCGEILPKNFAVHTAPQIAPLLAFPLELFTVFTRPIRDVLIKLADGVVRLTGGNPAEVRSMIVEEEFRHMVEMGQEAGALSPSEGEMIHRVFEFGDTSVDAVMTPSEEMFRVCLSWPYEKILDEVRMTQYSRIPVYADSPDDIVGILYVRDLFAMHGHRERGLVRELEEVVRPVLFVGQRARVEEVMREFQQKKIHIAVVVDDAQRPVGIVTMDDILGSLFGSTE